MVMDQKRQRYLERLERGLSRTKVFAYSGELLGTWQKHWLTDNAEEYFGVVKEDFLTKPEFIPEWCNLDDLALVHGAVAEIEQRRARGFQCEYRMTNLQGREFWLRDHASIFWSSDEHGTHYYVGILVDITDLKGAAGQTTPNPVIIFD
jgi:hypothetical protein